MHYSKFSVEDFANDEYFIRWVSQNDQEAEKFWNLFISLYPEVKPRIDQARTLVLSLKHQAGEAPVTEHQVDVIWEGIQRRIENSTPSFGRKQVYIKVVFGIAASLVVVALFLANVFYSSDSSFNAADKYFAESVEAVTEDFLEEVNTSDRTIRIHLSDSSIVYLEKNSRLRYKENYGGEPSRHVFLTGKAFFKVNKNPRQPFFVHANEVVTKVLGTSFSVTAYNNEKDITVAVTSGKVSVFSPKKVSTTSDLVQAEVEGVILLPNQQVVYQRDQELFEKTLVDTPEVLSPHVTNNNFTFENAPIPDVFHVLEDAYGVEIIFDEDVMKTCFITAPLGAEPLFEKLRIICRTIGANYEIIDTKVVINSSGCQ